MQHIRKLAMVAGTLAALAATGLAAQDQMPETAPQSPMGQHGMQGGTMPKMGMMQQMSQMMETCNKMMQAAMAQPHQLQGK